MPDDAISESLRLIDDLKFFLATAPANWQDNQVIRRYYLNNDEGFVSCVFWNNLYFITGTDIVRCVLYKFEHFGRKVTDRKKFEEGIFSDLRNLKAGQDAILEPPKLEFLEFLYKNLCLRTQKKQKVFYWFNVPHDKLMADALERDIKKEKMGQTPTSVAHCEPALLFQYLEDKNRPLYDQLNDHLSLPRFETSSPDFGRLDDDSQAIGNDNGEPNDATETENISSLNSSAKVGRNNNLNNMNNMSNTTDPDAWEDTGADAGDADIDFPLDYIDKMDFIALDPNYQPGSAINAYDTNFDSIDPAMFHHVPVANTDDYLIEQTVPVRMPPRLARDDFLYVPFGLATGAQFPSVGPPAIPSAGIHYEPFWLEPQDDYLAPVHEPFYEEPGFDMRYDQRYDNRYGPMYDRHERYDERPDPRFDRYDSRFDSRYDRYDRHDGRDLRDLHSEWYEADRYAPSQRQQDVSASMMRKRQQLRRVTKPERPRGREYEWRMAEHLKLRDRSEALVLTPESTVPEAKP